MDALTDILKTVHLKGSVHFRSELDAPWNMRIPSSQAAQFHVVRQGRCFLSLDDQQLGESSSVLLESGDIVVLPKGDAHLLVDSPKTVTRPLELIPNQNISETDKRLGKGARGIKTTLICGIFSFQNGSIHPLLSILPELIVIRRDRGGAQRWLESTVDLINQETIHKRPGSEIVIDRLTESLFIHVIRSYLEHEPLVDPSWLQALSDQRISKAMGLIHQHPGKRWTIAALASHVGMSRTAFCSRFKELVGQTPLSYLTRRRMQLAATYLSEETLSLSEIAEKVGYQTEAAFSKVFKKLWGVAPGAYRREKKLPETH